MSGLASIRRRRVLAWLGIELYQRRRRRPCVLIRLDRPKQALSPDERRVLSRLLKALEWQGPFRDQVQEGERVVLEIALGVPASGRAERFVQGEPIDRLAVSEQARRALWQRIAPLLPLPGG